MTNVFLADSQPEARLALRLLLLDLNMQVVGEAADWPTTLAIVAEVQPDMIIVDWDILPPYASLRELRATCITPIVILLISQFDSRQQAALSAGADSFISKNETPNHIAERLRSAVPGSPSLLG